MRTLFLTAILLAPVSAVAQGAPQPPTPEVETIHSDAPLYVETIKVGSDWIARGSRPQDYVMGFGPVVDTGQDAFVIRAKPEADISSHAAFGTLMQMHPPGPMQGKRIKLSARLKTDNVHWAQLWMRVDWNRPGTGQLYNMDDRPIRGTTDWKRYEIVLDVPQDASAVAYGFFIAGGRGTAWADSFVLEEVGNDVPVNVVRRSAADILQ